MKIRSISACAVDVGFQSQALQKTRVASPMSRFPRFTENRSSWMWPTKKAFVRIEDDQGHVGWACTNGGEIVEMIVNAHLARLLIGEPADQIETLWEQMTASLLPNDRSGFAMMAVAAMDIALWDLRSRSQATPLVTLLGGARANELRTYATTTDPEGQTNRGWHGLKAAAPFGPEAGTEGLAANVALMKRFAEAAGPDTPIMIDAFMAWDADYCLRYAEAVRDIPMTWIEDPLPPNDIEGLMRVRRELDPDIALALGNFAFSRADCADLIRAGVVDVLQPDVAWAGGITETLRILEVAQVQDLPVILHNTCEQPWALSIAAACQDDPLVEFVDRGPASPLYSLCGPSHLPENGATTVPRYVGNTPIAAAAAMLENLSPQGT